MSDFEYHSPGTLEEACGLLKKYDGKAQVLAGGTDLIPDMYYREVAPEHVVSIKRIPGLNHITYDESKGLTLGALVTFNKIIYSEIIKENFSILKEASTRIASHQIRNLATVGGNLCNAAPSADSVPILIALDSTVTIIGPGRKERTLPLEQFFTGPGTNALAPGEILTEIRIPSIKPRTGMVYIKHTTRQTLEIAVVGVASLIQLEEKADKCCMARVVIGACAPTPLRIHKAEEMLAGKKIRKKDIEAAAEAASKVVEPISDVRGGDLYRREMVRVQGSRALKETLSRALSHK